uniref:Maxadilan related protein n=1 Tax=Nyssomyia intermedia TaxID=182990 RepID=J7HBR1_9DIPT
MKKFVLVFLALAVLILCNEVEAFSLRDCVNDENKKMIAQRQAHSTSTFSKLTEDELSKKALAICLNRLGSG